MLTESIARRYARALFDAALAQKAVDTVGHELNGFVENLEKESGLNALWVSARLPAKEKKAFLQKHFGGFSALMIHFLFVLIGKKRESLIEKCALEYEKMLLDFYNQALVEVTASSAMPEPIQRELSERLSKKLGKRVELLVAVDRSLLGGVVLRIGDRVVDGSLRTKLEDLREELLKAPIAM